MQENKMAAFIVAILFIEFKIRYVTRGEFDKQGSNLSQKEK